MNTDLFNKLEQVTDRDSFFAFVKALIEDRKDEKAKELINPREPYGSGANDWVNENVEDFLEAALAWAEDTNMGQSQELSGEPSWKSIAVFLYSGKIYE